MTALANEVCFVIILMYTHCHYLMIYTQIHMENKKTYACVYVFIWKIIFNKQVKTTQEVCNAILSCENLPCERTAGRSPVKLERPWLSLYASRFYIICNPGIYDMHWKYACVIGLCTIPTNSRYRVRCFLKAPIFKPEPNKKYRYMYMYDKMNIHVKSWLFL